MTAYRGNNGLGDFLVIGNNTRKIRKDKYGEYIIINTEKVRISRYEIKDYSESEEQKIFRAMGLIGG